jgi:hypothetical protein
MTARGATSVELERFRTALEAAIARSSLRAAAGDVGMSPTGLSKFLSGGQPYGKTLERLRNWYSRQPDVHQTRPNEIANQLRRFVGTLPHPDAGVGNILEAVDRSYALAGMVPPEWVQGVRDLLRAEQTP